MNTKGLSLLVSVVLVGAWFWPNENGNKQPATKGAERASPVAGVERNEVLPVDLATLRRVTRDRKQQPNYTPELTRAVSAAFPRAAAEPGAWWREHPASVTVAPYADLPLTFFQSKVRTDGHHLTWVGRNPDLPGASFVGVAVPGGYDAVLLVPGASQFNFHVRDGKGRVDEVVATGSDCANEPILGGATGLVGSSGIHYSEAGGASGDVSLATGAVTAPKNVDVLFLFNTRAFALAAERSSDPVGYLDGYSRAALETCNAVLQNSRIEAFIWRYVGLVAVPDYPAKELVPHDLEMIASDGPFDGFVRAARDRYGADQVMMWVGAGFRQGASYAGDVPGEPAPLNDTRSALRLTGGILILAHELAHNFGCYHDRGHAGTGDGSTAAPEGNGFFSYGLLWNDPPAAGAGLTTSGTVMAYSDFLIPYFSNPAITVNITSTLENRGGSFRDLGTRAIGFPESDPRASNNARTMSENAAYIAGVSAETEALPEILRQPSDSAVGAGQTFSLSVSAVGGGLTFQWAKAGANIVGATEATYGKALSADDAGSYAVRISNSRGSVTSRSATVALATFAPTPVPTAAPAAAASGGGGGAPGAGFYLALAVLTAVRFGRTLRAGVRRKLVSRGP